MKKRFDLFWAMVLLCSFFVLVSCSEQNSSTSYNNSRSSQNSGTSFLKVNDNSQQSSVTSENSSVSSFQNSYDADNNVSSEESAKYTSKENGDISEENNSASSKQNITLTKENSFDSSNNSTVDLGVKITKKYSFKISDDATFKYETFNDAKSGKSMPYRLHIPKKFKSNKQYPVILFLHGAGEIGSDNEQHLGNFKQGFSIAGDLLSEAIIVCPQTPAGWSLYDYEIGDQNGYLAIAKRIVDRVVKKYNGDTDRIYVTGLSLGSFATWDIIDAYPNYFAAAVPVCGGAGSYASENFINTPIWIFHGTADPTVSYESSLSTYQAIINNGGRNVKFTALEGVAHNAWDYAYKDRAMFSWLLAQKRKNTKMVDNYKGILEIVSADGTVVINEKNIENFWGSSIGFEEYMEVYFDEQADALLKQKLKKNKTQTFTLRFFGKRLYDFKFTASPKDKNVKIIKTVNDETYRDVIELLENTLSFNKEINGF